MLKNGEHVAAFWLQDDGTYSWYLGNLVLLLCSENQSQKSQKLNVIESYIIYIYILIITIGVVCDVYGDHTNVSYLKQTDKVGVHWVFPEEIEMQQTSFEQIMASGFEVKYTQSAVRIRCSIEKAFAEELSNEIRNIAPVNSLYTSFYTKTKNLRALTSR